jgi:hypothetical protein
VFLVHDEIKLCNFSLPLVLMDALIYQTYGVIITIKKENMAVIICTTVTSKKKLYIRSYFPHINYFR